MDSQFWLGVIVTIPLTIISGFFVNRLQRRFDALLDARNSARVRRSRQQALRSYMRIKAFHDGTKDRYPYYLRLASVAVVCAITASTLILITVFQNEFPLAIPFAVFVLLAALASLVMLLLLTGIYETARQIERFDDYKAEFEQRWGPIDNEHP
jgi:biopolymer transport protein ExbB/TolQ